MAKQGLKKNKWIRPLGLSFWERTKRRVKKRGEEKKRRRREEEEEEEKKGMEYYGFVWKLEFCME